MHVYLDHSRTWSHFDDIQTRIARRGITFYQHRNAKILSSLFNRREKIEIVFQMCDGRHEDVKLSVTRLDGHRGPDDAGRRLSLL